MFRRSIAWISLVTTLAIWPVVAAAQYEMDFVISDSGRNNAWSPALTEDPKRPGLTFSARGKDGKPVGGILADTAALQQLLVGMPPDSTLKLHRSRLRGGATPDYQRRLFDRMWHHANVAVGNSSPVFEIRLLQHATPTGDQVTHTARLEIFAPQAYAAIGKVINYYRHERHVRVHVTAALSDTGAEGFALASEAWRPYADLFRRVDIVDGHASLPQARAIIEALGAKRVRMFTSTGAECPAMTVGREEVVDRLLREHPGLIHYRIDSLDTASASGESALLPWHENLAGQRLARITRRRCLGGTITASKIPDPLAPQQFRPPMAGWSPQAQSALLSLATAAPAATEAAIESLALGDPGKLGSTVSVRKLEIAEGLSRAYSELDGIGSKPAKTTAGIGLLNLFDAMSDAELRALNPQRLSEGKGGIETLREHAKEFGDGRYAGETMRVLLNKSLALPAAVVKDWGGREVGHAVVKRMDSVLERIDLIQRSEANVHNSPSSARSNSLATAMCLGDRVRSTNSGSNTGGTRFGGSSVARQSTSFDVSSLRFVGEARRNTNSGWAVRGEPLAVSKIGASDGILGTNKLLPHSSMNNRPSVKGVLLQAVAQFEGDSVRLHANNVGLVFRDAGGGVDLPRLRCFVTALWAAYLSVEGPGISIDPSSSDPNKERLQRFHNVRYIGQVEHTDLGRVMRETDYIMKQWAVGTVRPDIPSFLTPEELGADGAVDGRPSRFWIFSPPEDLRFSCADDMLLLKSGSMRVETEYLGANPNNEINPANERFAQWFTKNYHGVVSAKYPVYEELFEYAQLTSIGTWLREKRVPMLWFLMANREMLLTEKTAKELPRLQLQSNRRWFVRMYGGVDMKMTSAVRDPDSYQISPELALGRALADVPLDGEQSDEAVHFRVGNEQYATASSQSMALSAGKAKGEVVQTDMALWRDYSYPRDEPVWNLTTPGLELVRHYNPDLQSRAEFGVGWHILVPYRLEDAATSRPVSARTLPARVAVVNQLSGVQDVMQRVPGTARYEPVDEDISLAKVLVRTDKAWLLEDKLTCTMQFDLDGDLIHMQLRPPDTVEVKLPEGKRVNRNVAGYEIRYRYERPDGDLRKMLTQIKQGAQVAKIEWASDGTPQITQIRGLQDGVSAATVEYGYGDTGVLQRVLLSEDLQSMIQYTEEGDHTVVRHGFGTVE